MADKGYYYLKLKENFFESDELKILESLENGYLYSNILLKLYLKALKNEGRLTFNEFIPYDVKMLATITGHNIDIVEKAIKVFQNMHLIEILDNGTIYMLDMQKMIGSISSEGVRKQEYRERINLEKKQRLGTKLGQCPYIISNSNSISNSNLEDTKYKEKNINTKKESNYSSCSTELCDSNTLAIKSKFVEVKSNTSSCSNELGVSNTLGLSNELNTNLVETPTKKDQVTTYTNPLLISPKEVTTKDQVGVKVVTNKKEKTNKEKAELNKYLLEIFDKMWDIYPKKEDEVRSRKKFLSVMKGVKTKDEAREKGGRIFRDLHKYVMRNKNRKTEDTYIKVLANWIADNFDERKLRNG